MGAELLAPFAKWGAALLGAAAFAWFFVRQIKKRAEAEVGQDRALEVGDALDRFQRRSQSERDAARSTNRSDRIRRLRDELARRRSS